VPLLLAVSPDFGKGHAREAELLQRLLHFVDLVRANDAFDELHAVAPASLSAIIGDIVPLSVTTFDIVGMPEMTYSGYAEMPC